MSDILTVAEFCDRHDACKDGRDWALANCRALDDVWATAKPEWLVWVATRPSVLDDRTLRLFAVYCARSVEYLLTDQRSRDAIDVAERFAHGEASREELAAAWAAARAADGAVWAAARAAEGASEATEAMACAAAWAAARAADGAVWAAARAAEGASEATEAMACAAAWAAVRADVRAAARQAQADWLRENATPNFKG